MLKCRSLLKLSRLDRNQPNMDILDTAMYWCAFSNLTDKLPAATYNDLVLCSEKFDRTQVGYETKN